jgi:hypothetical protein
MGMNSELLDFRRSDEEMERIKLILVLGTENSSEKIQAMSGRVRVIFAYRAEIAEKIIQNKHDSDPEIDAILAHMIEHYNEIIRDLLAL